MTTMAFNLDTFMRAIAMLPDRLRYLDYRHRYNIADSFYFNGPGIYLYGDGEIEIGEDSYIGRQSSIESICPHKVHIGKKCAISHYVMIYTENRMADQDMSNNQLLFKRGDVTIGDYCWIGAHVFINLGVTIGENSVIGANSVVTRDIPPFSIAVGSPAKVIKFKSCMP